MGLQRSVTDRDFELRLVREAECFQVRELKLIGPVVDGTLTTMDARRLHKERLREEFDFHW